MLLLDELAESRIREAVDRGELDNLPGAGRPLDLDDDRHIPEAMRMACRVMKNAGYVPPEVELRRDINALQSALAASADAGDSPERRARLKKLHCLFLRLDESRRRQTSLLLQETYYENILKKL